MNAKPRYSTMCRKEHFRVKGRSRLHLGLVRHVMIGFDMAGIIIVRGDAPVEMIPLQAHKKMWNDDLRPPNSSTLGVKS